MRKVLIAALLAGVAALPVAAQQPAQKAPATKSAPPAPEKSATSEKGAATEKSAPKPEEVFKVDGFRSASFGATEQQVRNAIRKDFNLSGDKIAEEEHPVEKTTVLSVTVNDLLPDAGPARVTYILGFKSKKLIQVNLIWGTPVGAEISLEKMVGAANTLRQHFLSENPPRETTVVNQQASDGSVVIFQGADGQKRTKILRLMGKAAEGDQKPAVALALSYIQDTQHPDVFRISKGQF